MDSNEKLKQLRKQQRLNLEALRDALNNKAYIVPKGNLLSPQIADKTVKPARKPLYGTY